MGKQYFLLIISLLAVSVSFSYTPIFADLCSNLSEMKLSFNASGLNTSYINVTEMPKEFLIILNQKLARNPDMVLLIKSIENVTFSAEIYYNKTLCFSGSMRFSNSSLEFLRLRSDPLKGTSNSNIYFYAELVNLEAIFNEWIEFAKTQGNNNPGTIISLGLRTTAEMALSILKNDFKVKPFSGIFKVFGFLRVLPQLSISKEIESNLMSLNSSALH